MEESDRAPSRTDGSANAPKADELRAWWGCTDAQRSAIYDQRAVPGCRQSEPDRFTTSSRVRTVADMYSKQTISNRKGFHVPPLMPSGEGRVNVSGRPTVFIGWISGRADDERSGRDICSSSLWAASTEIHTGEMAAAAISWSHCIARRSRTRRDPKRENREYLRHRSAGP